MFTTFGVYEYQTSKFKSYCFIASVIAETKLRNRKPKIGHIIICLLKARQMVAVKKKLENVDNIQNKSILV